MGKKYWYNSHGRTASAKEIFEIEVVERGNYKRKEFLPWMKKYGITWQTRLIWGCDYKTARHRYNDGGEPVRLEPREYGYKGFVCVKESNDGDNGYLLALTAKAA